MNYFNILGIIFGLAATLKPFYMHLLPYNENKVIAQAYTTKRPKWVLVIAILGLSLVALTWYKELTTDLPYSMVITVLFSLTAIKAIVFVFDYRKFQQWIAKMLADRNGRKIVWIDMAVGAFGLIVLLTSILII